jgi:23S rRNA pseudouridine2605 synthase
MPLSGATTNENPPSVVRRPPSLFKEVMEERLQKLMAQAGLGSRRHNEALIEAGRVRVNGKVARLGDKADPAVDRIEVDGVRLKLDDAAFIYVALNKPRNVLSSLEDERGEDRPTVRDLVDLPGHLYPVGRLDRESEGLILMTNDGDLAHKLTHPRYGHDKVYRVTVEGRPSPEVLDQWRGGIMLEGRLTLPVTIDLLQQQKEYTTLRITMREGRKRQIRRIAALLGHPVRQLVREQIGPLLLGNLKVGRWRHLTAQEVKALRQVTRSPAKRRPAERPPRAPAGRTVAQGGAAVRRKESGRGRPEVDRSRSRTGAGEKGRRKGKQTRRNA